MKSNAKKYSLSLISSAILASAAFTATADNNSSLSDALVNGKASANLNLRYESVDQDNAAKGASALTLRTRLNYTTAAFNGFSAAIELENAVAIIDDYKDTLGEGNKYSVVADPEHTELDQACIQYKGDKLTGKIGRQVITMDNHRFVGHVG